MIMQQESVFNKKFILGAMGCFGGMLIHLVIGSLYQWGIINIYITSYYRTLDPEVTLEKNAIAFPIMMICYGFTMRLGLLLAECLHPIFTMCAVVLMQAAVIFSSSYLTEMEEFIAIYGIVFGLLSGLNFMVPIVECNKYFPDKRMYVNAIILTGSGLGSVVFGLFSYNYLNPLKISPNKGYYIGTPELESIANKVPECLRWLSLLYLLIGLLGVLLISYVCLENRSRERKVDQENQIADQSRKQNTENIENDRAEDSANQLKMKDSVLQSMAQKGEEIENSSNLSKKLQGAITPSMLEETPVAYPQSIKEAVCTRVYWLGTAIIFCGSCGVFMLNGNYKTYVKDSIHNDELLTVVGVVGSLGNGCSRFFWNLLFNRTGYKFAIIANLTLQIAVFATLRFTAYSVGGYLFLIFLNGCCLGGFLVSTPTFLQIVFGQVVGSNIYGLFWEVFGLSNLLQYAFVSGLSMKISFNGIIYICLGMASISAALVAFGNFEAPWKNPTDQLGYCQSSENKQK